MQNFALQDIIAFERAETEMHWRSGEMQVFLTLSLWRQIIMWKIIWLWSMLGYTTWVCKQYFTAMGKNCCKYLFLFALGDQHDDSALSLAPSSTHALNQSNGAFVCIEANDKIHISNVQAFFSHTGWDECIVASFTELLHYLMAETNNTILYFEQRRNQLFVLFMDKLCTGYGYMVMIHYSKWPAS